MGKREDILAATGRVMREHGLTGITVARVLQASGAGYGTMYHYFSGKDALVDEYFRMLTDNMWAYASARIDEYASPRERFEQVIAVDIDYTEAHFEDVCLMEQHYFERFLRTGEDESFGPVVAALGRALEDGQAEGSVRQGNVLELRQAAFGLAFAVVKGAHMGMYKLQRCRKAPHGRDVLERRLGMTSPRGVP